MIANNGREAVEAVKHTHYDAVLMDIQMPVMGGYEATQVIRADEKFSLLPIIAMTAHAMQGAKEDCLEAGMNDYVSKPIDPSHLFSVIKKWVKSTTEQGEIPKINEIASKSAEEIELPESMTGIDVEAGLKRLNGNRKLYRKLLVDFSVSYLSYAEEIRAALEQDNIDSALRLVHTIKGVAGNISAYDLQNIAIELEKAVFENKEEKYADLLNAFDKALKAYNELVKNLAEAIKAEAKSSEKLVDSKEVEPLLQELARLVSDNNIDAEQALENLIQHMDVSRFSEEIKAITQSISDYEFEAAKAPLAKIAEEMKITFEGE